MGIERRKRMKNKKVFIVWCIGLTVIALITIGLSIARLTGVSIPDAVIRILGTMVAIAGPVVLIVGARMYNAEKEQKKEE